MPSIAKRTTLIFMGVVGLLALYIFSQLFENNHAGYVQVKQTAVGGKMSVVMTPGMYPRMFGTIHEYKISDVYDFSQQDDEIKVRFNDAATAQIGGQIKYRLPLDEQKLLQIHQDFRSDQAVESQLVRAGVAAVLRQTSSLFGAEEVYSTRRADFIALLNDQLKEGIYQTTYTETPTKDDDGNIFIKHTMMVKTNPSGHPIIQEESALKRYGVEIVQVVINDPVFDEKTSELIAERKKADQQKVVARAQAERAKQDALTAEAEGRANVARAEAEANVKKKTATVAAEQETEVAHQRALQAEQYKAETIAKGEADAQAAALKVKAGLSPLERATIEKETSIGVAHELAAIKLPEMMVLGGSSNNSPLNPFDAVGLKSFIDISKGISRQTAIEQDHDKDTH